MYEHKKLLDTLRKINSITNDGKLDFGQRIQNILNNIVVCMNSRTGSIMIQKNRTGLEVIASTIEGLIGVVQPIIENTPSSWVLKNKRILNVPNMKESKDFVKRFDHYDGEAFLISPIISNGKVIGIVNLTDKIGKDIFSQEEQGLLMDIASQLIGTLEIQRLLEQLKGKKKKLQQKNKKLRQLEGLKDDLYNMLIHDLKGPISEMISNLDILSYVVGEENLEYLESAKTSCSILNDMVANLLDIVRIEEGKLRLIREKINPEDLIKECTARLFGLSKMKNLKFLEKYPEDNPLEYFWGDRGLLIRVFQNLITNAINHSPAGEEIEIGYYSNLRERIFFYVKDRGPGVPPEHREAIFDKFFNLGKGKGGGSYSTGLGLTFCRMAMEAHGGNISVEEAKPRGSCFIFKLPVKTRNLR